MLGLHGSSFLTKSGGNGINKHFKSVRIGGIELLEKCHTEGMYIAHLCRRLHFDKQHFSSVMRQTTTVAHANVREEGDKLNT